MRYSGFTVHRAAVPLLLLLFVTGTVAATPVQWPGPTGNGHYYEAVPVPDGISWPDAKAAAEALGGYLATITSTAENDFVYSLVSGDSSIWLSEQPWSVCQIGPWLGGTQPPGSPEPAGGWRWVTSEPWAYSNWHPGEPNNANLQNEDSLVFLGCPAPSSNWNDYPGDGQTSWPGQPIRLPLGFIVEWDEAPAMPVPASSAWGLVGLTLAVLLTAIIGTSVIRRRSPAP